jgi:hypothetical protein
MPAQLSPPLHRQSRVTALLRLALAASFILAIIALMPATAAACSCMPSTPEESLERSHAAFVGTVVDAVQIERGDSPGPAVAYAFAVEAVARGARGPQATVVAGVGEAACGITFQIGQRWLIFARTEAGRLATGLCDGNVGLGPDEPAPLLGLEPVEPAEPAGPSEPALPIALLIGIGGVLLLAVASGWAFRRRTGG